MKIYFIIIFLCIVPLTATFLPKKTYNTINHNAHEECPICFYPLKKEKLFILHKNSSTPHYFHQKCLRDWSKKQLICPLDRKTLTVEETNSLELNQKPKWYTLVCFWKQ